MHHGSAETVKAPSHVASNDWCSLRRAAMSGANSWPFGRFVVTTSLRRTASGPMLAQWQRRSPGGTSAQGSWPQTIRAWLAEIAQNANSKPAAAPIALIDRFYWPQPGRLAHKDFGNDAPTIYGSLHRAASAWGMRPRFEPERHCKWREFGWDECQPFGGGWRTAYEYQCWGRGDWSHHDVWWSYRH
jgi:hypothetical protein